MKIPKNVQSIATIENYVVNQYKNLYQKGVPKRKMASRIKHFIDKDYDYISYFQSGKNVEHLVCVVKTKNDWGKDALLIIPFQIKGNKIIKKLVKELKQSFPNVFEYTFVVSPQDKNLIKALRDHGFTLDATMLIGEIQKSLLTYEGKFVELPKGILIKKFNFKRDYLALKKIKSYDARNGLGDSRLDFSKKVIREKDNNFWKMISSSKSPHEAIGIWSNKKLIGAMALMYFDLEKGVPRLHIGDVIIDMKYRGRGYSHYLYKKAFLVGKRRGIRYFTGATTTTVVLKGAGNLFRKPYQHCYTLNKKDLIVRDK
jgi:hypothetical protein